jgi:hypothetical protein
MADLQQFERWAARARQEQAPQPDVAPAVMRKIRRLQAPAEDDRGLWAWALGGAGATAAVCGVLGYFAWWEMTAPWVSWARELSDWWSL